MTVETLTREDTHQDLPIVTDRIGGWTPGGNERAPIYDQLLMKYEPANDTWWQAQSAKVDALLWELIQIEHLEALAFLVLAEGVDPGSVDIPQPAVDAEVIDAMPDAADWVTSDDLAPEVAAYFADEDAKAGPAQTQENAAAGRLPSTKQRRADRDTLRDLARERAALADTGPMPAIGRPVVDVNLPDEPPRSWWQRLRDRRRR